MLKQDFLKLISILIRQEPGQLVSDNQEALHSLSKQFNEALQITRVEEEFHTEMMYEGKSYLIPPVPFASTNKHDEPLAFAFLGLNPKLFLEDDTTIEEKKAAGETWDEYATSYTTNQRNEPDIGNFYRRLTVLMESLKSNKLVKWPDIIHGCKNADEKLVRYLNIVEKDPILVGEFIPLHSSEIGTYDIKTVQLLFEKVEGYESYLTELFTIISNNLAPNGWLITNGKGASATLEMFIENNLLKGKFSKILDNSNQAYTCYLWEHDGVYRKILLLHQFLGTIDGKLNSYTDIEKMVLNVVTAFASASPMQDVLIGRETEDVAEIESEQPIDNGYESFGEYAAIAERIDQFILKGMRYSAYRMENITGGVAYHKNRNQKKYGFAKLCNNRQPFLILRFGGKSAGDHLGIVKQIEFDRKLGYQTKRNLNHIYNYPNEAFIYLKNLAEHDNEQAWKFVEDKIMEAYRIYYSN